MPAFRPISLLSAVLFGSALAQTPPAPPAPPPKPKPCSTPEYRQFDFWLGDWQVRDPSGRIVGENRIVSIHGGCVLQENWTGNGGVTGSSLNGYDADRKQWHQTWMDGTGGVLQIDGGFADGRMTLAGDAPGEKPGEIVRNRITWTPQPDGKVRQLWESSTDGGKTWTTAFDGMYSRK
jgi:hypothetical protein